jgi:hypothetical protein
VSGRLVGMSAPALGEEPPPHWWRGKRGDRGLIMIIM